MRKVHRDLVGKHEAKKAVRRPRRRSEDNIKWSSDQFGVDWIQVALVTLEPKALSRKVQWL
jgi:hypothetical protein